MFLACVDVLINTVAQGFVDVKADRENQESTTSDFDTDTGMNYRL
jgi:hypothetical protein